MVQDFEPPTRPHPPQQGIDEGRQFQEAHGFDQVLIGAALEPHQFVFQGGPGREQDDPRPRVEVVQPGRGLDATAVGEHEVKNAQVDAGQQRPELRQGAGLEDDMAAFAEKDGHFLAQGDLILQQSNTGHRVCPGCQPSGQQAAGT